MAIRLNNSYFRVSNGSFRSTQPFIIGQIYRVVNTGGTTSSLSYTKIDGTIASTGNLTSAQIAYILAVSGSLSDSTGVGTGGQLTVTNLLITSTVDITPTFTEQLITTTGAGSWTKPVGVTEVIVECWGGGGSGGGATQTNTGGGGGAGGQYVRKLITYTSPSASKPYSVAASVAGSTGNGTTGNDTTWETNVVISKGGSFGFTSTTALPNGDPGTGSFAGAIGDVVYAGGNGNQGFYFSRSGLVSGGGGGGGAGSSKNGESAATPALFYAPGASSQEFGGTGGTGVEVSTSGANGGNAINYGGGGAGASTASGPNRTGGSGAQGLIRLIYR